MASAGDVNGDGYADVIVGALTHDAGSGNEGAAFVFHGGPTGIGFTDANNADAILLGGQLDSNFGAGVATAGDVNADGYADVLVGAPGYDNGEIDEGVAFVFLGSATGIAPGGPATADTWIESDQASARLGESVATAGDVRASGMADLILGAPGYAFSQSGEGAAFVIESPRSSSRELGAHQHELDTDMRLLPGAATAKTGFVVKLPGTHPMGSGLVKAEVEWCPPGVAFGDASCGSQLAATWTPVGVATPEVVLSESIPGLPGDQVYRWRARVLRLPSGATSAGITPPALPAHGPWRRPSAQSREADVRVVPEPGFVSTCAAAVGLLALLRRRPIREERRGRA